MASTTAHGPGTDGPGRGAQGGRAPKDHEGRMTLGQHLVEFRKRMFVSVIAIAIGAVAGWVVTPWVLDQLRAPVTQIAHATGRVAELNFPVITGAFDLKLQIAVTIGVVVTSPVWLYEIWAFIVPALVRRERMYVVGFFGTAIPLFLIGCAFGWYILPRIVTILTSFVSSQDTSIIEAKTYYDFVIKLVLAVGIAFVLPVFLVLLNFVGVLTAKAIIGSWRIAIIAILVFTAIVTPSADIISMFILALPMVVLYLAACGVSLVHDRRVAARADAIDAELGVQ